MDDESLVIAIVLGTILFIFSLIPAIFYLRFLQRILNRCSPECITMPPRQVWLMLVPGFNVVWHFFVVHNVSKSLRCEFKKHGLGDNAGTGKSVGMAMCIFMGMFPILFVLACYSWGSFIFTPWAFLCTISVLIVVFVVFWFWYCARVEGYARKLVPITGKLPTTDRKEDALGGKIPLDAAGGEKDSQGLRSGKAFAGTTGRDVASEHPTSDKTNVLNADRITSVLFVIAFIFYFGTKIFGAQFGAQFGALAGGAFAGGLCGLVPYFLHRKRSSGFAMVAIGICILAGLAFGLLLALPWAFVLTGAGYMVDAKKGFKSLISAAEYGQINAAKLFLGMGAAVNARNNGGFTPLMLAAQNGHLDVVRLLLDKGAAIDDKDAGGFAAHMLAAQKGHLEVVKLLLDRGAAVDAESNKGAPSLTKLLVGRSAAADAKGGDGFTALMLAAQHGHLEVVKLLLERGATIAAKDSKGFTPIMRAAQEAHLEVVKLLLERGATVDAENNKRGTPIIIAAQKGHLEVVQLLLAKGAAIDARDNEGFTALSFAAAYGHLEVVKLLIDTGAAIDAKNNRGITPLQLAEQHHHKDSADLLRKAGAK